MCMPCSWSDDFGKLASRDNICGVWFPTPTRLLLHLQHHKLGSLVLRLPIGTAESRPVPVQMAGKADETTVENDVSLQPRQRRRAMTHPHALKHTDTSSYLNESNSINTNRLTNIFT